RAWRRSRQLVRIPHISLSPLFCSYFTAPATPSIYTLSLHDALPICARPPAPPSLLHRLGKPHRLERAVGARPPTRERADFGHHRSEEHTSELQSRFDLVCRLLLEKKNNKTH